MASSIISNTGGKANRTVYTTNGSFNSTGVLSYVNNVLETIRKEIGTYNTGLWDVASTTGPRYGTVLYKYNDSYWSALIMTYAATDETLYYAKYENGKCTIIAIN